MTYKLLFGRRTAIAILALLAIVLVACVFYAGFIMGSMSGLEMTKASGLYLEYAMYNMTGNYTVYVDANDTCHVLAYQNFTYENGTWAFAPSEPYDFMKFDRPDLSEIHVYGPWYVDIPFTDYDFGYVGVRTGSWADVLTGGW